MAHGINRNYLVIGIHTQENYEKLNGDIWLFERTRSHLENKLGESGWIYVLNHMLMYNYPELNIQIDDLVYYLEDPNYPPLDKKFLASKEYTRKPSADPNDHSVDAFEVKDRDFRHIHHNTLTKYHSSDIRFDIQHHELSVLLFNNLEDRVTELGIFANMASNPEDRQMLSQCLDATKNRRNKLADKVAAHLENYCVARFSGAIITGHGIGLRDEDVWQSEFIERIAKGLASKAVADIRAEHLDREYRNADIEYQESFINKIVNALEADANKEGEDRQIPKDNLRDVDVDALYTSLTE